MNTTRFVIFFGTVISILTAVNFYIFIRGWNTLPRVGAVRTAYAVLFVLVSFSYIAGRVLERVSVCRASAALIWIGSFWLAFMLYFFLLCVASDLVRLADRLVHFLPGDGTPAGRALGIAMPVAAVASVCVIVVAGYINACSPVRRTYDLTIPKGAGGMKKLTIAYVSDIHLGTIIKNSRLQRMIEMIRGIDPDLVLLGGDIVDEDIAPVIEYNMGEQLKTISSRMGVYAVTGNHEYIGGVEKACRYLEEHGITVLRDRAITIGGVINLAGREDNSMRGFSGRTRKNLGAVLDGLDPAKPLILMDHQPLNPRGAAEAGVDLQLSGHTHAGQLWPISFITGRIFEVARGYRRMGNMHLLVSNGYGSWGPPVRVGNRPEVVELRITFDNENGR